MERINRHFLVGALYQSGCWTVTMLRQYSNRRINVWSVYVTYLVDDVLR